MTTKDPVLAGSPIIQAEHPKKIIICLDGTNDQIGKSRPTNVGKTFEMLSLTDPSAQIAYYDPGVGTLPDSTARGKLGRLMSRGAELAFGLGIRANLIQAYTWLMQHYQFHDEIYIFGFSRGAYTARALIGMLNRPGLLRPGSENLVEYAVEEYARNKSADATRKAGISEFADAFCWGTENDPLSADWKDPIFHWGRHAVPIQYLGAWDTVQATGLGPVGKLHWPFTRDLPNVIKIRHAVSIDEHRGPYHEYLVDKRQGVEEVWFAGVHCDVGGTFIDCSLATIALKWVIDGVVSQLVLREADSYSKSCTVTESDAYGELHSMSPFWILAGRHHRQIPAKAELHDAVRKRMQNLGLDYRPTVPSDVTYTADNQWIAPLA
jgi:uncharacterized protein (DUF2235 family)